MTIPVPMNHTHGLRVIILSNLLSVSVCDFPCAYESYSGVACVHSEASAFSSRSKCIHVKLCTFRGFFIFDGGHENPLECASLKSIVVVLSFTQSGVFVCLSAAVSHPQKLCFSLSLSHRFMLRKSMLLSLSLSSFHVKEIYLHLL